MEIKDALDLLGIERVIWVDDWFIETAEELAKTLVCNLETTRACAFEELTDFLDQAEADPGAAIPTFAEVLIQLDTARRTAMRSAYLAKEHELNEAFATADLKEHHVTEVCQLLGVKLQDRLSFDGAEKALKEGCAAGDSGVMYVIDLKNAAEAADSTRGLELIKLLHEEKSKGTAFLLTHEARCATESKVEQELRQILQGGGSKAPVCVIAKERLEGDEAGSVDEGLKIALKRAGLRRGVHEVLMKAGSTLQTAFDTAAEMLLGHPSGTA